MHQKEELIQALVLVKENFNKTTPCSLCSAQIMVRKLKKHYRSDHHLAKMNREIVNGMTEEGRRLYRACFNRKLRFLCLFCNKTYERTSHWVRHLVDDHKITLSGNISRLIDLQIKALQEEFASRSEPRRRVMVDFPQETTSL